MIKVEKAEVELSEATVRSLLSAIEKAKKTIDFVTDPMPPIDMSIYQYKEEQRKRGRITVSSPYSDISFKIRVETRPYAQEETLGYELDELEKPEIFPKRQGRIVLMDDCKISDEVEGEKTIEWYKAQSQELKDIRKAFYKICNDMEEGDAYFPDLVEKEFRRGN